MGSLDTAERVPVETRDDWRAWLAANHDSGSGVWVVTWKKATGRPAPSYDDVVCEALAFGWVDSIRRAVDEERTMLYVAPRKARSGWSRPNKDRVQRLTEAGLMAEPGQRAVDRAVADGSWTLLDEVEDLVVPADLAAALDARPGSREAWDGFSRSTRRGILEWIVQAKRPATRTRRVEETADRAADGTPAAQWSRGENEGSRATGGKSG